jgi:16S rRNA (adenine1518-N6/adenine1519-N6)-dimethyltransferase
MGELSLLREMKGFKASKRMGQNFLINREIARMEATYAKGRDVIEFGAGAGILTRELCTTARSVLAVEKDTRLFNMLKDKLIFPNLKLVNSDFFDLERDDFKGFDLMVSNVPYSLSSKTISWLAEMHMEAVLCLQKDFVSHMLAKQGSSKYSKLSVMSALQFTLEELANVPAAMFYPKPKVDSSIIKLICTQAVIDPVKAKIISLMMEHKKKRIKNALADSSSQLGIGKGEIIEGMRGKVYAEMRPFQVAPEELLWISEEVIKELHIALPYS